ncbi:hypothetical protein [Marilutibacter chinensis]|uniref:hypothetical protein n=1 Tax=Marilutibacter chinensis TaxID=2912247 RepID=UPI001F3FCF1E|nr:hypothetical protein [Lysobacter chinensis]
MSTTATLLDKAKKRRSYPSDMALAAAVGVSRSIVSEWRKGTKFPSEDHVCALARMAGEDAAPWLVLTQAEKSTGPAHRAWLDLARQLGAAAALAVVALMVFPAPAKAKVPANLNGNTSYALCEVFAGGCGRSASETSDPRTTAEPTCRIADGATIASTIAAPRVRACV